MIEPVSADNLNEMLPLIREYQAFYGSLDSDDERNRAFFAQFNQNSELGCQFLYRLDSGEVAGFATLYFTFVSSIPARVGVMNDLFVASPHRCRGIGRKLINRCLQHATEKGAVRIQWLTAEANVSAQTLYDSVGDERGLWRLYTCSAG